MKNFENKNHRCLSVLAPTPTPRGGVGVGVKKIRAYSLTPHYLKFAKVNYHINLKKNY